MTDARTTDHAVPERTDAVLTALRQPPTAESAHLPRHAISFVLPAYNEEGNIVEAIESVMDVGRRFCSTFEVLVIDDGSTDRTADLATGLAARYREVRLTRHARNRGYGEALRTGFLLARLDYVFFTDADNQFDLDEIALLLPWADHVDVVAGFRQNRRDPLMRRLNAWVWNRLVRVLFYVPARDIDCAFKLFRREALEAVAIESVGAMVNTEVMVKLGRTGKTVVEVGVTHLPRKTGTARGAKLSVIGRALLELCRMYRRLSELGPGTPPVPPHQIT
jgi:hypothetical protein